MRGKTIVKENKKGNSTTSYRILKRISSILIISIVIATLFIIPSFNVVQASSNEVVIGVYGNNDRIQATLLGVIEGLISSGTSYTVIYLTELTWQNTLNLDILITDADSVSFNEETYIAIRSVESHGVLFLLGNASKFLIQQTYPYVEEKVSTMFLTNSSGKYEVVNSTDEVLINSYELTPYYSLAIKSEKLYTLEARIFSENSILFTEKVSEIVRNELFQSIFLDAIPSSVNDPLCGGSDWQRRAWYVYVVIVYDNLFYKKVVAELKGDWIVCKLTKSSDNFNWFVIHYMLMHNIYRDGYSCNTWKCGWFVENREIYSNFNQFNQRLHDADPVTTIGGIEVSVTLGISAGTDGISGGASATWTYPKPDVEIYAYVYPASNIANWIEKLRGPDYTWWPFIIIEPAPVARSYYRSEPGVLEYSPKTNAYFVISDATDKVTLRYDELLSVGGILIITKYRFIVKFGWPSIIAPATSQGGAPQVQIEYVTLTGNNADNNIREFYILSPFQILTIIGIIVGSVIGAFYLFSHVRIFKK
jgi:hypothetical protein